MHEGRRALARDDRSGQFNTPSDATHASVATQAPRRVGQALDPGVGWERPTCKVCV